MATTSPISFNSRTYTQIRSDLISYLKQSYPELSDYSTSSLGMMLLELNAAVGSNLNDNINKIYNELQLDYAQQRASILNLARTMGLNSSVIAKRSSVTVVDITVTVPFLNNKPDPSYYPILQAGSQFVGGGKTFELIDSVNFGNMYSNIGTPNWLAMPNLDSNGIIQSYNIKKSEVVVNGISNVFKMIVTSDNVIPFLEVTLPDPDVIAVDAVILLDGTNYSSDPTLADFNNTNNKYYQVDYLAQQNIFVENNTINSSEFKTGNWVDITKKFLVEYSDNGYCSIIFGGGDPTLDTFKNVLVSEGVTNKEFLNNYLNNTSLGEMLKQNKTLFVKYRTGGGSNSNIGANTLTGLGNHQMIVNGSRQDINQQVKRSLTVTNPIPAMGGNDGLNIEQIRYLAKYNYSSQNRCVTLQDYLQQVYKMPGRFGSPFRLNVYKENNKIVIAILGLDSSGMLSNNSNSYLKSNISEWLSGFREINDYIQVIDGAVLNLAVDVEVFVESSNDVQISNNIIRLVSEYFNINNQQMNQDIHLSHLIREIVDSPGVINLISLKLYNKIGGQYSNNITSQDIINTTTGEIKIINNTIYSNTSSMFEIKYPNKDIKVFLKK